MTRDCSQSCTSSLRIGLSVRVPCGAVRSSADPTSLTEVSTALEIGFSTSSRGACFLAVGFFLAAIARLTPSPASLIRASFSSACDNSVCNWPLHSAGSFSCAALLLDSHSRSPSISFICASFITEANFCWDAFISTDLVSSFPILSAPISLLLFLGCRLCLGNTSFSFLCRPAMRLCLHLSHL